MYCRGFSGGLGVKNLAAMHLTLMQEMWVLSLGQEDPLKKEMVPHSSILAWRTPRTEELGRLQSVGSQSQTQLSTTQASMLLKKKKYSQ